jgi:aminopeptidase N
VAGDLGVITDEFISSSGKKVRLEVYASHGKQSRCHHAMDSLKKAMRWDEERYGLEYDLNQYMIVSIDDFNMGAMENKGLNIFNSRLVLADPETATDTDFERIESVVAHEYFHNWTGNRVTCRNWFELSLKEGLTVFRDQEFSADMNSRSVQRIKDVDSLRSGQFTEDAGPNSHPVRPESCLAVDNFYTATIYEKGAEVIRMMQTIVGRRGFRKGMDEYFRRHDGQAVTIMDFADAIASANQADFSQFKLWYSQAGTPDVFVTEKYDATEKKYTLTLSQSCGVGEKKIQDKPFHIPLLIGLIGRQGQNMPLQSEDISFNSDEQPVIHLKQSQQTFIFNNVSEKPILSLNREFSAPIRLHWSASSEELLHLIRHDTDAFNRREAIYKMLLEELRRLIRHKKKSTSAEVELSVISAMGSVLHDTNIDASLKALMLQLPDQEILAQEEEILEATAFYQAQQQLLSGLVNAHAGVLLQIYHKHHRQATAADRALKNRILNILMAGQHPEATALAFQQFKSARNMTDSLMSLFALCEGDSTEKETALREFYHRWNQDSVVFNKWLQVQAAALNKNTFARVQALTKTAPFNSENPNNIYSLHMVLAENYYAMQQSGAEAYRWLCDEILTVDRINPQVAARLCNGFNFVKKFPESLRIQVQGDIQRLLDSPTLSKNSRELLETCLN